MTENNHILKTCGLLMLFLALAVSFSFQGSRGLYETSEGRYAESAREMLETGHFLEPTLGYEAHWTKPPMTYWAIASGIKILGHSEWGVRLYNAIAFFLTVLAVAAIGTEMWGRHVGLAAGLIYLSSPFPVFGANAVTTDTLLTLWEISAVMCYIKAHRSESARNQAKWIITMWLFFGLGFLTKGPPALLPLIPIAVWHRLHKNQARISILNPAGILIFLLVGLSWYIIVCLRHPGLLSYFMGTEVVDRVASDSVHNYKWYMPFVLYLPVLFLGAGPWLYPGLKTAIAGRIFKPSAFLDSLKRKDYGAFLLLWLLIPLFIFFLAKSRLHLYVLPLYAPVALGIARAVCGGSNDKSISLRRTAWITVCTVVVMIIAKGFLAYFHYPRNAKYLYETYLTIKKENTIPAVYEKRKLYGFQYYLNGPLLHVPSIKKKHWIEAGNDNSLLNSYVFITDKGKAAELFDALTKSGLSPRQYESGDYVLDSVETEKKLLYESSAPPKTS